MVATAKVRAAIAARRRPVATAASSRATVSTVAKVTTRSTARTKVMGAIKATEARQGQPHRVPLLRPRLLELQQVYFAFQLWITIIPGNFVNPFEKFVLKLAPMVELQFHPITSNSTMAVIIRNTLARRPSPQEPQEPPLLQPPLLPAQTRRPP